MAEEMHGMLGSWRLRVSPKMTLNWNTRLSEDSEALDTGMPETPRAPGHGNWYAIQTRCRHEKCVRDRLQYRGMETFLPLYEKVNRWRNGCRVPVKFPLFPGYLFLKTDLRDRTEVLSVPGVVSMVGSACKPWPLLTTEIEKFRDGLHALQAEPHAYLVTGQRVEIKNGPLIGLSGILLRRNGGQRVILSIDLLRQSVSVEVGNHDIGPPGIA